MSGCFLPVLRSPATDCAAVIGGGGIDSCDPDQERERKRTAIERYVIGVSSGVN
jgi:hypothetical protein